MSRNPTPAPSALMGIVRESLAGHGFNWTELDDVTVVLKFREQHSNYDVMVTADDAVDVASSYCVIPAHIPPDRRAAVAEAIMRVNYALRYGN
nr:YbjN domain-containing protein [Gemmatimonadaceae bacterium]